MTEPATAPPAPTAVTRNPFAMLVGLIAGALMIVGAMFLDWLSGFGSKGIDAGADIFWSTEPASDPSFFASAGFVVLIVALITLAGAALARSGWMVLGGVLGILAFVLTIVSFYRVEGADLGIGDAGLGLWAILVGGVLALVAGIAGRRTTV
ncbi:MAG: hypothetical protein ACRDH9_11895 [Actinomycetota bacterium]